MGNVNVGSVFPSKSLAQRALFWKRTFFSYHVTFLKRESVNSNCKFKKQEEINIFDFQRDELSIGLIL